jgi:hypothetical protein
MSLAFLHLGRCVVARLTWSSWLGGCAAATWMVATTACLRIDPDHCVFSGGDVSCSDRACGAVLEGHMLRSPDPAGCVDLEVEQPDAYVHVEYGLLLAVTNGEGVESSESRPRTVEDVLRSRIGDGFAQCEIDEDAVRKAVEGTAAIWRRLEHLGVRRSEAYLRSAEVQAIETLNSAIDGLLETCGIEVGTSSGTTDATMSSGASDTGGMSTTEGPECMMSADCLLQDSTRPICVAGVCVACYDADGDASCAMEYPETPACVFVGENAGSCVECRPDYLVACTEEESACPVDTCMPCTAHEQCGGAACNFCTGECLPDDAPEDVVHVGGATPDFDDLTTAVAETGDEVTIIVHAGIDYDESVIVGGGRVVAFVAAEIGSSIEPPRWVRNFGNTPQLTVGPGSTVVMDGLELRANQSSTVPGLRVSGHACIDRSHIVANAGSGIVAQTNSELVVRNSFVGGNGSGGDGSYGIDVIGADVRVLYSTIARNDETAVDSIHCSGGTVDVRNSIVIGRDASSIECPGIAIVDSALDEDVDGNVNVGAANLAWFTSGTGGDFHLTATGATVFADIARWTDGDPMLDIDGDARPTTNDTPDFAGADTIPR